MVEAFASFASFEGVLYDFFQGIGMGTVLFLMALPVAGAVRWAVKVPATWGRFLRAFCLFVLAHGIWRSFVSNDLVGFANILLVPSALYLACAWMVSSKADWLWRGFALLIVPVLTIVALVAAMLVRSA